MSSLLNLAGAIGGFMGGGFAWAIGGAAAAMTGVGKFAFQTLAHSFLGGMMSTMSGDSYGIGALSGGIGSMAGSGMGSLLKDVSKTTLFFGTVGSGSVMGGISSKLAGGSFWDGFRNVAVSTGLNHFAHSLEQKITINSMLRRANINPNQKISLSENDPYIMKIVKAVLELNEWYEDYAQKPKITNSFELSDTSGEYTDFTDTVWVNSLKNNTNFKLTSTLFHEFRHAWQYQSGLTSKIKEVYGTYKMDAWRELDAHSFQIFLGDNSQNVIDGYNKYLKDWMR